MKKSTKVKPVVNSRDGRKQNALGKASKQQIIAVAEGLLKDLGYHGFSTRKVAEAVGISVGNLTYHFPNKVFLVEAIMSAVCERYASERLSIRFDKQGDTGDFLRQVVGWMVEDAVDSDTSSLFLELWVLAKHHEFGTRILEQFYQTAIGWICQGLHRCFPHAAPDKQEQAAYFLLTVSEGCVAVFSRPCSRPVGQLDIVEYAVSAVLGILGPAGGAELG